MAIYYKFINGKPPQWLYNECAADGQSKKRTKIWMSISTHTERNDSMSLRVTDWSSNSKRKCSWTCTAPGISFSLSPCFKCTISEESEDVCGRADLAKLTHTLSLFHSLSRSHPPRRFIWWPSEPSIVWLWISCAEQRANKRKCCPSQVLAVVAVAAALVVTSQQWLPVVIVAIGDVDGYWFN